MNTRIILLILPLLMMIGACSDDDPAAPGTARPGIGFGTFTVGDFQGPGDAVSVVDVSGGDIGIKDADNTNSQAAKILITSAGQTLFTFTGIDICDLSGTALTTPGSGIRVEGFHNNDSVGVKNYEALSSALETKDPGSLLGKELTSLRIEIKSTGDDDFCIGFVGLEPVATRLLDFRNVPTGAFEHLFVGAYELTWAATGEQASVVDDGVAPPFAQDDNGDQLSSVFVVERTSGGAVVFEGLIALDLEGAETHNDSRILIEGYDGATLVASAEYRPDAVETAVFAAGDLAGLEVTSLRVDIKSICGQFKCDNMAVSGLLLTNVD